MALTPQLINAAVERYLREFDRYEKLSKFVGEECRTLLEENAIRGSVQWRAKDPERLRKKLEKYLISGEHAIEFTELDSIFHVLKDLARARITTYVETDRARVTALVEKRFSGFGADSHVVADVKDQPSGFYRATHCMVRLKNEEAIGQYQNLRGLGCELQVCSYLAHVYHELEHDIRYKPLSGALSKKQNDLLNALARHMEVGDTIANLLSSELEAVERGRVEGFGSKPGGAAKSEAHFRDNPFLNLVAGSPLLLKLADLIQSNSPHRELPETPADFYREMIRLIANGALSRYEASVAQVDAETLLATLPRIAWQLFSRDASASQYEQNLLLDAIVRATNCSETDATEKLAKFEGLNLLVPSALDDEKKYFQFVHNTFRDFLAAAHIASYINQDGWDSATVERWQPESGWSVVNVCEMLERIAFDPSWQIVFVFIAGLMNEPFCLFQILADRHKDDLYRHRLGLLCRCYRGLGSTQQANIAPEMDAVFDEVLRIAKRCEHDDEGHRKPWLEWAEMLLPSAAGAERLCSGLLALDGRYHGWAVSLKVLELMERVLTRGKVSSSVVDEIARFGERDEHHFGVNTAGLALSLAEGRQSQKLVERFVSVLEDPETSDRVRIRLAEAVATSDDSAVSKRAGEMLIAFAQSDSLAFEHAEKAVKGLVALLETSLGPIAAPLLISHLLNPSSQHHFWLAWRIIGRVEREPDSAWSAVFLGIILYADREDDRRLKLWSAQVLSKHSQPQLRELGLRTLLALAQEKKSHSWVHAARWLVEFGPDELAERARDALLEEASRHESDHQRVATAELLEMGTIDAQGGPIKNVVRESVVRELKEYGQEYGSRLHVTAPGAPNGNVDMELFADNPAAVIKLLHTFNGPSFYLRDRDDPNEEKKRMRHWNAKLLQGTRYWPEVFRSSMQAMNDGADCSGPLDNGAMGIVLFGGSSSDLLGLLRKTFERGRANATMRHYLLDELYERGWRLRIRGRQIEVLHEGKEKHLTQQQTISNQRA